MKDAKFACQLEVDWIALSFVRHAEDLIELQNLIREHSQYKIPIIAKIEKPEGVANIDKIVAYCDGLMVARGDLGVEVPAQEVPLIQKKLVLTAKKSPNTGYYRYPDDGNHDYQPHAYQGRGERCGKLGDGRGRRRDAKWGNFRWTIPGSGNSEDGIDSSKRGEFATHQGST